MQNPFQKRPKAEGTPSLRDEVKGLLFSDLARARALAKKQNQASPDSYAPKFATGELSFPVYLHNYRMRRYSFIAITGALAYATHQLIEGEFMGADMGVINGLVPLVIITLIAAMALFSVSFRCYQMRTYRPISTGQYFDAIRINPLEALPLPLPTPQNKNDKGA